jgi:hypothetical protein
MFCRPFSTSNPADRVFFQKGATDVAPYEGGCYGNITQAKAGLKPGKPVLLRPALKGQGNPLAL